MRPPRTTGAVLVLLRHGESEANAADRFAGRLDVPLTPRGVAQADACGRALAAAGLRPRSAHTSPLTRAARSAELALGGAGAAGVATRPDARLVERHYGALQGMRRDDARARWGEKQVRAWRRSWDAAPPPAGPDGSPPDGPRTESLADVATRLLPWWDAVAAPDLRTGGVVLVCAHGNSLRALVALLDDLSPAEVPAVEVPVAAPLRYDLDGDLRPVRRGGSWVDVPAAAVPVGATS